LNSLNLNNPWWSIEPGPNYTIQHNGVKVGPGKLATTFPGVFNVYSVLSDLGHPSEGGFLQYRRAQPYWEIARHIAGQLVDGADLGDTTLVLNKTAFSAWLQLQPMRWTVVNFTKEQFIAKILEKTPHKL
jgi:hypothetical protein